MLLLYLLWLGSLPLQSICEDEIGIFFNSPFNISSDNAGTPLMMEGLVPFGDVRNSLRPSDPCALAQGPYHFTASNFREPYMLKQEFYAFITTTTFKTLMEVKLIRLLRVYIYRH